MVNMERSKHRIGIDAREHQRVIEAIKQVEGIIKMLIMDVVIEVLTDLEEKEQNENNTK